jgi:Domain of unknown function (DUF4260)
MKHLMKLEEIGLFAVATLLIYNLKLDLAGWLYIILFFSPDIGMVGYAFNTKIGAITYNLFHHKGIACVIWIFGIILNSEYLILAGLMILAHAAFDRILGYGLKYFDSFKHTSVNDL